ncbi:MAG TPA: (Fe-S)-binding protein [Armatimonadetes bacterium]|jgi:ferredoxin|nr:(Fe-S)-binding protein [Armatimonadota bacterium]
MASTRVVFHFPRHLIDQPVVSYIAKTYELDFNILRASITPESEGLMVLGLEGAPDRLSEALAWAETQGVRLQPLERDVVRDDTRCTQCGACVTACPTGALQKQADTQRVGFDADKCIACELCVPVCPPRAMEVAF